MSAGTPIRSRTPEQEIAKYRRRINVASAGPTVMLTVTWAGDAIGWCQWCRGVDSPDAANAASRRVLEKNGFELVTVRPVATEPTDAPMAIYRLAAL